MTSNLFTKDTYVAEGITHIVSSYIREYDIAKANINILLYYGVIDRRQYNILYSMPGYQRQVTVGLMCRHGNGNHSGKSINQVLSNGFKEFRQRFFEANDIQDYEVLSIRKDAIFLVNKIAHFTEFDNIQFTNDNVYTSYYRLSNFLEAYYFNDKIYGIEKIDFKGISDDAIHLHKDHIVDFFMYIFELAELGQIEEAVSVISNFYRQYVSYQLDIGYYRQFDSKSLFMVQNVGITKFGMQYVDPNMDKTKLDIGYNLELLRNLMSIFSEIHFRHKK